MGLHGKLILTYEDILGPFEFLLAHFFLADLLQLLPDALYRLFLFFRAGSDIYAKCPCVQPEK